MKYRIKTEGMGCPHCIARVTKMLDSLGVKIENMALNDFTVEYDGGIDKIKAGIEDLGFGFVSAEEV